MRWKLICVFILSFQLVSAQFKFDYSGTYEVTKNGKQLKFPWAGGLNFPQFSSIDYNFDGTLDLVIFDRSANQFQVYKSENNAYHFVPNGADFFPESVRYRMALVDYDNDGRNDLFTYGVGGVKVFRNTGSAATGLTWEETYSIVNSQYVGTYTNLYISSSDIPAFVDVDHDGDIDILTFHISGERLEYHQNQSIELYGHADSLVYELKNECWGKFTEDPNGFELILNAQVSPCNAPNLPNPERPEVAQEADVSELPSSVKRHSGSTVLAIDMDNSSTFDLILGDVSYNNLIYLKNGGTQVNSNSAMVFQDVNFPSGTISASLTEFPAAFWLDVDFDGNKDLIVAPNAKGTSDNTDAVLKYKNVGNNQLPVFTFEEKGFFQDEMMDVGTGAIPAFFDANGDGLMDLIVANQYKSTQGVRNSGWSLFVNVGSATLPKFDFVTDDYLNLANQTNLGLRKVPCFGDIDGDQLPDLLIGTEAGKIYFCKNLGMSNGFVNFSSPLLTLHNELNEEIALNSFVFPQLADINKDGKLDLLVGKQSGEISYYVNLGNQQFQLLTTNFGNLSNAIVESFPAFQWLEFNDTSYLFLGGLSGGIKKLSLASDQVSATASFQVMSTSFLGLTAGAYSVPTIIDLDNDGNLELFLGSDLGGILHFEHDENSTVSINELVHSKLMIYPNPSAGVFHFSIPIQKEEIEVFDQLGRRIDVEVIEQKMQIKNPISGIYYLRIKNKLIHFNEYFKLVID